MFNADLALSVTMTTISTILSMIMLPLNLIVYTHFAYNNRDDDVVSNIDWIALFISLAVVITAVALGLFCSWKIRSRKFNHGCNKIGNFAGLSLIIFSSLFANTGETKIWSMDWPFYVGVTFPCLAGLILSNVISSLLQLKRPERVTVSIECCYQNVGIATSLALSMFDGEELTQAMGVPFFYGAIEAFLVGTYCVLAWKIGWTKAPPDAPIWKVLWTSYEVLRCEQRDLEGVEIEVSCSSDGESMIEEESLNKEGNILTTYFDMGDNTMFRFWERESSAEGRACRQIEMDSKKGRKK